MSAPTFDDAGGLVSAGADVKLVQVGCARVPCDVTDYYSARARAEGLVVDVEEMEPDEHATVLLTYWRRA